MTLQTHGLQTLDQIRSFLVGNEPLEFDDAAYEFVSYTVQSFEYARLSKADKGLIRRYLCKVTGRSREGCARRLTLTPR